MAARQDVIHSDPEILGGAPVFVGTRVPVKALLDYLEAGERLDEFLDHFPGVSREQAVAALDDDLIDYLLERDPRYSEVCDEIRKRMQASRAHNHAEVRRMLENASGSRES